MIATTSKVDIVRWDINKKKKAVESFTLYYDFIKAELYTMRKIN